MLDSTRVVDDDDLEVGVGATLPAAEELATNAAETVDGNAALLSGHGDLASGAGAGLLGWWWEGERGEGGLVKYGVK